MEPKKVIAIFFVLAILAVAIGFGVTWFQSQEPPDGYYNYKGEFTHSFESDYGTVTAPEGKKFYVAEMTVKNDKFGPGLSTEQLIWKISTPHGTLNMNEIQTHLHKDFISMTLDKGKMWKYTVVFMMPENYADTVSDVEYTYASTSDNPRLSYDKDLTLPTSQIMPSIASYAVRSDVLV